MLFSSSNIEIASGYLDSSQLIPEIEPVADFVSFDDEVECMQQDADCLEF